MKLWLTVVAIVAAAGTGVGMLNDSGSNNLQLLAPDARRLVVAGGLTLIDIRTPEEWRQTGVAQGAKRVNMVHPGGAEGFVAAVLDEVDGNKGAPIGLICRTGNRTGQVQKFLQAQGFTQVYDIAEGMAGSAAGPGWLQRGLPVDFY